MGEDEQYIDIVGRMPRYDNDGIEVTNETLGSGGSRREDGTLSAMAKNLRIPESDAEGGSDEDPDNESPDEEPPSGDPGLLELAIGIGIVTTIVVAKGVPRAKSWWIDSALPALKTRWNRLRRKGGTAAKSAALEVVAPLEVSPADTSAALAVISEDELVIMSSVEAQRRYVVMMMAMAFAVKEMRTLRAARIQEPEKLLELKKAVGKVSTPEAVDMVNRMLEADNSLLDNRAEAAFAELFGGGARVEGKYSPILREQLAEILHLDDVNDHSI